MFVGARVTRVWKWFVKVSRPASVYLHPVRDKPKSNMCIKTQVAVADVAPTSAPRHAARVRTWLKGATEWVGGWGVCMSVWVGVATVLREYELVTGLGWLRVCSCTCGALPLPTEL